MKRTIAFVLATIMLIGLLAGCNTDNSSDATNNPSGTSTTKSSSSNEIEEVDFNVHEEFSIWLYSTPSDYYSTYSDNPVTGYLNKKFNVTLNFEQPSAGTEQDSLSLMLGTGSYTDMIETSYYNGSTTELYEDGVIIDIAEYLDYMPNFKKMLDSDELFRKSSYDNDGRILKLKTNYTTDKLVWGGLVYRRDILETMTGGNISFPSGNDEPVTIADWDYMLPLFKQYFEAAGMTNHAVLMIPYNGYFPQGQLTNGFGVSTMYYQSNGNVKFGAIEEGFYNYLKKMNEWYEAGYIYQDFASRSNDMFYLPNPEMTYGGAAGIWFGMPIQLDGRLSIPEYNLIMDVKPILDPIDEINGVEKVYEYSANNKAENSGGYVVTSSCENIPKLLSIADHMYSEEGSLLTEFGLNADQGAADDPIYQDLDLTDGTYTINNGNLEKLFDESTNKVDLGQVSGSRYWGLFANNYSIDTAMPETIAGHNVWSTYVNSEQGALPLSLSMPLEDSQEYQTNNVNILDYLNSMVPKFIMGTEPLNDESFKDFVNQLKEYGIDDNIIFTQTAYDNYLER